MFGLLQVTAVGFIVCLMLVQSVVADPLDMTSRRDAWRKVLDHRKFESPDQYSGLLASLRQFTADCKIHVIYDPKNKRTLEFKFIHDGREILSLRGHAHSAFTSFDNTLYLAKYPSASAGCTVLAYDLASGKKLWQTDLHHAKPHGHSAYANYVTIRMSHAGEIKDGIAGAAIVITGMESYCDYVEVLDRQAGTSLAIKNYRTGFGPPPPAGGRVRWK